MVSIVTAALVASFGFMCYLAIPFVANSGPIEMRERVGTSYLKLGAKSLKQFTFVRRILSGYDVLPIKVDDEQKLLKVTLKRSYVNESSEYPFKDPDNRISRLWNKPVALAYEQVPAAIDAELSELGHWMNEKHVNEGIWSGDLSDPGSIEVDPWIPVGSGLRLVDPIDAYNVVVNDVDAENIKTAEKKTKERFNKYGSRVDAAQMLSGALGFATGIGGMMLLQYFNTKLLDGAGGGGVTIPQPIMLDVVVTAL